MSQCQLDIITMLFEVSAIFRTNDYVLSGGELVTPLTVRPTNVVIGTDGSIKQFSDSPPDSRAPAEILDVSGCYVTPGLIDLQVNGDTDCDLWSHPVPQDLLKLCAHLLSHGVTCFLPTLITDDLSHMIKTIEFLQSLGVGGNGASPPLAPGRSSIVEPFGLRMPGIHLEGPCLSPEKNGVHPSRWLQPLTPSVLSRLDRTGVLLMTVAPELDDSGKCIEFLLQRGICVSLGHSNATFEEAVTAFNRGVRMVTHTFNALPAIHHRAPGAVTAALLDDRVYCCVIADGLHVDPAAIKLLVKTKGPERTILVTDSAHIGTSQGTLVGSSCYLGDCVRNLVDWGIASFQEAIRMSTWNPAEAIGLSSILGDMEPGKAADLVVWDKATLSIRHVIAGGRLVF